MLAKKSIKQIILREFDYCTPTKMADRIADDIIYQTNKIVEQKLRNGVRFGYDVGRRRVSKAKNGFDAAEAYIQALKKMGTL